MAVREDVVEELDHQRGYDDSGVEQRHRRTGVESRARFDRHGHDRAVEAEVVQLSSIAAPLGLEPAFRAYLPLAVADIRERLDDNLARTGFVRRVREPEAVGRLPRSG